MKAMYPISVRRKIAFYSGYLLWIAGGWMLISALLLPLDPAAWRPSGLRSVAFRLAASIILFAAGGLARRLAAWGLAGSGLLLDPPRLQRDLEPWFRAAGELLGGAIERARGHPSSEGEGGAGDRGNGPGRIPCPRCEAMNDSRAKFCGQCALRLRS